MFSDTNVFLYGVGGTFAGSIFQLAEGITSIGRDGGRCSIVFMNNEPGVSSVHCQVVPTGTGVILTDLGSSYGTFFQNGMKLEKNKPYNLKNGDIFYLGDANNRFMVKVK